MEKRITQGYLSRMQEKIFGEYLSKASLRMRKKRCPICMRKIRGQSGHEECHVILERFLACSDDRLADPELRLLILKRDGHRCRFCTRQVRMDTAHFDHLIPWSRGGRTVPQNLVSSCRRCNMKNLAIIPSKGDLEWMTVLRRSLKDRFQEYERPERKLKHGAAERDNADEREWHVT